MQILKLTNISETINTAVEILNAGGLVIYPTETCYGVAVNATDSVAVKKLLKYKKRPSGKAISIAVSDVEMAGKYVELNKEAKNIYKKFLPGPITVISKSKGVADSLLESEYQTLGVRIPDYEVAQKLIEKLGVPITATSANSSGKKTPYSVEDILDNLTAGQKALIDVILDAGQLPQNPPSTVIDTTRHSMQILRQGQIKLKNMLIKKRINNDGEMIEEGENLVKEKLKIIKSKGLLVLMNADLGAGKTHFVKGIGKSLGVEEIIKSPTYSIIEEYDHRFGKLVHVDTWRLENDSELKSLDLENYFRKGYVVAIEWAGREESYFKKIARKNKMETVQIEIDYVDLNSRELTAWQD